MVRALTERREATQSDRIRKERGKKQKMKLTIEVKNVEYQSFGQRLRCHGVIAVGERDQGSHHTLILEPGDDFDIGKSNWLNHHKKRLKEVAQQFNAEIVIGDAIYDLDMDIYAPCALGATLNPETIARLNCAIISGSANNQLADENRDGQLLLEKGIIYAPDFLINAGGIINVYRELKGYSKEESIRKTENIYNTTLEIFKHSDKENITTHRAAFNIAQNRIDNYKKERNS